MNRRGLFLAVAIGLLIGWGASRPPAPRAANAPATAFSAERAMADVRVIAREPHPVGSPANARVRDHLLTRLSGLGLETSVQRGAREGVRVENVVGVLPGADRTAPALLLMAHYDSVPRSPGAADDAAGVASLLEAVRAFKAAGGRPVRDVIVLLTDGEERGLHGAHVWFGVPANAARIGTVLNFEARGASGRAYLFETGAGNAALIDLYADAVGSPSGSSLARFVYDRMPNGTDFTIPKRLGVPGLNFAFIGDEAAYHTPLATPERLDQRSLQHMGDQALALLTKLSSVPSLPGAEGDKVFADVFGAFIVSYAPAVGWGVLALSAVFVAAAGWSSRRDGAGGLGLGKGALRLLAGLVLAGLLLYFARRMLSTLEDGLYRPEFLAHPGWLLSGVGVVLAAAILVAWSGRPSRLAAVGALASALVVASALQALAPETAFVLTWPVLAGGVALLFARRGAAGAVIAIVLGALGVAWIAGLLHLLFLSVGRLAPEALALGALLLPLVLAPLLCGDHAAARRGAERT